MIFPEHLYSGYMEYTPDIIEDVGWPLHFHRNMELIYVLDGAVNCTALGRDTLLQKDEFALFLSNEPHAYSTPEHSLAFVVVFSQAFVPYFANSVKNMQADRIQFRCSDPLLSYIRSTLITKTRLDTYKFKSCLYGLISEYLQQITLSEHRTDSSDLFTSAVTGFVSSHYQSPITLADMARELSFNYSYLSRNFQKNFSVSFTEFVNQYRISHAIELLTNSSMKITDIGLASGFQSIRSFNDCFRKQIGMTPKEYRTKHFPTSAN